MQLRISFALLSLIVALLSAAGCLHQRPPTVVTGILTGEIVWEGEVRLSGDVILSQGAHLTILPGTTVRFLPPVGLSGAQTDHPHFPGSELIVQGRLTAVGTAAAPITFQSADDAAPAGSWGALNFEEGAGGVFAYCIFRQADSAIHAWSASVSISESLFEKNQVGIRFNASRMRITHNLLRDNAAGIRFHLGEPVVCNNRFEGNRVNLFVTSHPRDYLFANNWFGTPLEYQVVLGEEVPEDVQLPNNHWNGDSADAVLERVFDGHLVPYLGRVLINPQLDVSPAGAGPSWIR